MKINPIAFTIFNIDVRWYGILIAIGALLCIFFAEKLAKKEGLYDGIISNYSIIAIILGIIGARVYYVVFEWDYYSKHLGEIFAIRNGGLAIYGGIIVGLLVAYLFCKSKNISFFKFIDTLAPGVALAQGIGRWGNFINGEAHGGPTNLPWAIEVNNVLVHPTFLYESILDVSIFIYLYFYLYKNKKFDGQISMAYFLIYGIGRFIIEGLRTDSLYIGPFRISQLVSLAMILFSSLFLYRNFKKARN
ncbi:MAG: prolipoprotein diacylglyceryl transferase [Peptoniphilaceae bacterium]